jgi:hypothetical protein
LLFAVFLGDTAMNTRNFCFGQAPLAAKLALALLTVSFPLAVSSGARAALVPLTVTAKAFADDDLAPIPDRKSRTDPDGDISTGADVATVHASSRGMGWADPPYKFEGASLGVTYNPNGSGQQGWADFDTGGTDLVLVGPAGGPGATESIFVVIPVTLDPLNFDLLPDEEAAAGDFDPAGWNNILFSDEPPPGTPLGAVEVSIVTTNDISVNGLPAASLSGSVSLAFGDSGAIGNGALEGLFEATTVGTRTTATIDPANFPQDPNQLPYYDLEFNGIVIAEIPVDVSTGLADIEIETTYDMQINDPFDPIALVGSPSQTVEAGGNFGGYAARLRDGSDYRFAVIPEVSSCVCWALLMVVGALVCSFRRRSGPTIV